METKNQILEDVDSTNIGVRAMQSVLIEDTAAMKKSNVTDVSSNQTEHIRFTNNLPSYMGSSFLEDGPVS